MSECNHNCSECHHECHDKPIVAKPNELSKINKVIAIASGKGGVGKSLITSLLAVLLNKKGYQTAILDADITGPSIPKIFNAKGKVMNTQKGLIPVKTKKGIQLISSNLLLKNETDPVLWRGPIIAGLVKQFWTDVIWENVDFMFVDMPPGTGDVSLTVYQSIDVDGIIIVTSPQELVSMIVSKAVKMAQMMNIPILGIIENMSYLECDNCHNHMKIFGESNVDKVAEAYGLKVLAKVPLIPQISSLCDEGEIENIEMNHLDKALDVLEDLPIEVITIAVPVTTDNIEEDFNKAEIFHIYKIVKGNVVRAYRYKNIDDIMKFFEEQSVNVVIGNKIEEEMKTRIAEEEIIVIDGEKGNPLDSIKHFIDHILPHLQCEHQCEHEH